MGAVEAAAQALLLAMKLYLLVKQQAAAAQLADDERIKALDAMVAAGVTDMNAADAEAQADLDAGGNVGGGKLA